MRSDKAEFELLLTVGRILRVLLRYQNYAGVGEDIFALSGALKPFDPVGEKIGTHSDEKAST